MKTLNQAIMNHGTFGEFSRYKLTSMTSRFGNEIWFVADANILDKYGLPAIIRQAESKQEAIQGLS
jgi:hypothetical protein